LGSRKNSYCLQWRMVHIPIAQRTALALSFKGFWAWLMVTRITAGKFNLWRENKLLRKTKYHLWILFPGHRGKPGHCISSLGFLQHDWFVPLIFHAQCCPINHKYNFITSFLSLNIFQWVLFILITHLHGPHEPSALLA
jgi:hypothetical protein